MEEEAVIEAPPCSCKEFCLHSFRDANDKFATYTHAERDRDARGVASMSINSMNAKYQYLSQGWQSGKSITKRWRNMSQAKRRDILQKALVPPKEWFLLHEHAGNVDIYEPEPEDSDIYEQEESEKRRKIKRNQVLLHYIDVESLERDYMKLLGLFQNRTRFSPQRWAAYDNLCLTYPWETHLVGMPFSKLCMDMREPGYGTLVDWDREAAHRGEIIGYPRAYLLLELQRKLYGFLKRIIEKLLEGIPAATSSTIAAPFELKMTKLGRTDLWSPYTNQPYSPPPSFDIDQMISKAQAQVNLYYDRVWLLQTDAGYLRKVIELSKGALPPKHSNEEKYREAAAMIPLDTWHYWSWSLVLKACTNVKQVHRRFADNIGPGQPLPKQYEEVLQELESVLNDHIVVRFEFLFKALGDRVAFKKYFQVGIDDEGRDIGLDLVYTDWGLPDSDPIFYALQTIASKKARKRGLIDTATRWAYLEESLIKASPEEADCLDEELYEMYNSFAVADELEFALQFHEPKPRPMKRSVVLFTKAQARILDRPTVLTSETDKVFNQDYSAPFHAKAPELLQKFVEAYDRHMKDPRWNDRKRLDQLKDIHKTRRDYWRHSLIARREALQRHDDFSEQDILNDLEVISANDKKENLDLEAAERQKADDRINLRSKPKRDATQEAGSSSGLQQPEPAKEVISIKGKEKMKTRPEEAAEPVLPDLEPLAITPPTPERQQLLVSKQSLDILTKMVSTGDEKMKDIDWNVFVSAIVDAGFSVTQTSGSMVDFQPIENHPLGWSGRLVLHRPHPTAKVHYIMLRALSKRFARWFEGWNEVEFVVRNKDEKKDE